MKRLKIGDRVNYNLNHKFSGHSISNAVIVDILRLSKDSMNLSIDGYQYAIKYDDGNDYIGSTKHSEQIKPESRAWINRQDLEVLN